MARDKVCKDKQLVTNRQNAGLIKDFIVIGPGVLVGSVVEKIHYVDLREHYVYYYLEGRVVTKVNCEQYDYESSGGEYEVAEYLHPVPIFESLV